MKKTLPLLTVFVVLVAVTVALLRWTHPPTEPPVTSTPATSRPGTTSPVPPSPARTDSAEASPTPVSVGTPGSPIATPIQASAAGNAPGSPTPAGDDPASGAKAASPPTRESAVIDLDKARHLITSYHTLMGQNPVGTNAEIMKALMGGNPHQASLGPLDGQQLNAKGELIDPWGTPYFFHQLSGDVMEIHSAGPDKIMGTSDDLVVK